MQPNNLRKASAAEHLCVIVLMFLFVSAIMLLVAMGTSGYRSITKGMSQNYSLRTSLSYVATKIRQGDKAEQIRVEPFNGLDSLVIEEIIDEVTYQTWVYTYDGGIYEMFSQKNIDFQPEDGMRIMDIDSFEIKQLGPKLISLSAGDKSGKIENLNVAVRT